jgi:hypothetical protein
MYVECYEQNLKKKHALLMCFSLIKPHACTRTHPRAVIALHANLNFTLLPRPFKRAA